MPGSFPNLLKILGSSVKTGLLSEHLGLKSQDDVLRWLEDIELFLAKCLNWGLRVHIAAAFSCQDHCLSSSRWWCTRHQWSSLGWFRRWPFLEVWVLFVELPFHYHADIQYTACIYIYIYIHRQSYEVEEAMFLWGTPALALYRLVLRRHLFRKDPKQMLRPLRPLSVVFVCNCGDSSLPSKQDLPIQN